MSRFDDAMRDGLAADASRFDIAGPDLGRVRAAARRRQRRNRALASVATAVAVVGAGVGIRASADRTGHTNERVVVVGGPGAPSVTTGAARDPMTLVPSTSTWKAEVLPYGQGLGATMSHVRGDGALVALSTSPGNSAGADGVIDNGDRWMYRSDDGVHWTGRSMAGAGTDGGRWLVDLDHHGNSIVGVGTAPASAPIGAAIRAGDLVVSTSTDEGATFHDTVLPFDLRGASNQLNEAPVLLGGAVATSAKGTMVGVSFQANVYSVLPPEARTAGVDVRPTDTGIVVGSSPSACASSEAATEQPAVTVVPTFVSPGPTGTAPSMGFATIPLPTSTTDAAGPLTTVTVPSPTPAAGATTTTVIAPAFPSAIGDLTSTARSGETTAFAASCDVNGRRAAATTTSAPPSPARTFTWQQLGLGDDAVAALLGRPLVFFAADGEHFARVTVADPGNGEHACGNPSLTATADGFAIATSRCRAGEAFNVFYGAGSPGQEPVHPVAGMLDVHRTTDGVTLTPLDPLPIASLKAGEGTGVFAVGDTIAVVGWTGSGGSIVAVANGTGWAIHDLHEAVGSVLGSPVGTDGRFVVAGDRGRLALAAFVAAGDPLAAAATAFRDGGITLRILDLSGTTEIVDDATGEVIYRGDSQDIRGARVRLAPVGGPPPGTTSVVPTTIVPAPGQYLTPVYAAPTKDIEVLDGRGAVQARFHSFDIRQTPVDVTVTQHLVVLHTRDGVTWSGDDLTGRDGQTILGIQNISVSGEHIVVNAYNTTLDPTATPVGGYPTETVAFVGTFG